MPSGRSEIVKTHTIEVYVRAESSIEALLSNVSDEIANVAFQTYLQRALERQ